MTKLDRILLGTALMMPIAPRRAGGGATSDAEGKDEGADQALKTDGPTVAEFVTAGYQAKNYPPEGYTSRSTQAEIDAAIAAQADSKQDGATAPAQGDGAAPAPQDEPKAPPMQRTGPSAEECFAMAAEMVLAGKLSMVKASCGIVIQFNMDPDRVWTEIDQRIARLKAAALLPPAKVEVKEDLTNKVLVIIPKAFKLTTSPTVVVKYNAGTQYMPKEHAEHWYSVAMGVKIVDLQEEAKATEA